ncbi:Minichromosome maintenance domain-containing protein 2, partial [Linnemannia elongata]
AKLGQHIQLIGRVYRAFPEKNQETYLHGIQMDVNNLIHLPNRRDHETLSETITAIITSNMSPWNTSQAIVDLLDGIVPLSIYRKLKLALLLSAVSVAPSDSRKQVVEKETTSIRRSIHVLVVMNGRDTIVPALMASMAALKSYIFWDHGEETIRKELYSLRQPKKSSTGEIRGSEMSTAKDGIVLFELDQLDKKAQAQIIPVLTTVDGSDIGIQRDNLSQQLDLICCCWATHTSFYLPSKKSKSTDSIFDEDITGPAHRVPLNEKFDIVVGQHELDAVSDVALSVAKHSLRRHMQDDEGDGGPSRQLSREDLSQYVQIASTIQVRLSTDCEQLLRAYFQVMRKKASGSDINSLSSLSTMSTLLNVASCHAKVCLRSVANRYDALVRYAPSFAHRVSPVQDDHNPHLITQSSALLLTTHSIMIMEETIAARFGTSCLGFAPLLDGKENVARLYARSEPIDVMSVQGQDHTASHVPVFDSCFEMDEDMDDFSTVVTAAAVDTDVPMNLQETRDQVMEAMYAHLTRVISEYADSVDV